ncbi:MAG: diacylglycerol kinase family lipid kinase [Chloroflexota bacterium]
MTGDVAVVLNPAAGRGYAGQAWPGLAAAFRASGVGVDCLAAQSRAEATALTRRALGEGHRTVVAVGGDGTVNAVANGFFDSRLGPLFPGARLGLIPCGTANDLARALGVPRGRDALGAVLGGTARALDVGRLSCGARDGDETVLHFLAVADLGLGSHAVRRAARVPYRAGATMGFLLGAILAVLAHRDRRVRVCLDDGREFTTDLAILVVANTPFFGGGMHIAPRAACADGLFEVIWAGGVSRRRLLLDLLPRVYRGTHLGRPGVGYTQARGVTVYSGEDVLLQADGELLGTARPRATFTMLPRALHVLVPPAPAP